MSESVRSAQVKSDSAVRRMDSYSGERCQEEIQICKNNNVENADEPVVENVPKILNPGPDEEKQEPNKWTSDAQLLHAVNEYFEALTEMTGRPCAHQPLTAEDSDPIRTEFRNIYVIMSNVEKQAKVWHRRVAYENRRKSNNKQSVKALEESVARMEAKLESLRSAAKKYLVDEAAQKNAIDLVSIRLEELNMDDDSLDQELFGLSQDSDKSDNEFDVSNTSEKTLPDGSKYDDLAKGNALATKSLSQVSQVWKDMKRRRKRMQKLRKTSQKMDKEIARLQRELQNESNKVLEYAGIIETIVDSEAWQKANGLL